MEPQLFPKVIAPLKHYPFSPPNDYWKTWKACKTAWICRSLAALYMYGKNYTLQSNITSSFSQAVLVSMGGQRPPNTAEISLVCKCDGLLRMKELRQLELLVKYPDGKSPKRETNPQKSPKKGQRGGRRELWISGKGGCQQRRDIFHSPQRQKGKKVRNVWKNK